MALGTLEAAELPRPIRPQVCRSYISCLNSRASISNRFPPALAAAVSATCSTSADRYLDEPRITYCEELLLRRETPQSTLRSNVENATLLLLPHSSQRCPKLPASLASACVRWPGDWKLTNDDLSARRGRGTP